MKIKAIYKLNKEAKVGDSLICPSCGTPFVKSSYQQVFCKTKTGTYCKDKYWNTVTPNKKNNTTRISPASQRWLDSRAELREQSDFYEEHIFSSEGLGQE